MDKARDAFRSRGVMPIVVRERKTRSVAEAEADAHAAEHPGALTVLVLDDPVWLVLSEPRTRRA